jgi:hypothetical protein
MREKQVRNWCLAWVVLILNAGALKPNVHAQDSTFRTQNGRVEENIIPTVTLQNEEKDNADSMSGKLFLQFKLVKSGVPTRWLFFKDEFGLKYELVDRDGKKVKQTSKGRKYGKSFDKVDRKKINYDLLEKKGVGNKFTPVIKIGSSPIELPKIGDLFKVRADGKYKLRIYIAGIKREFYDERGGNYKDTVVVFKPVEIEIPVLDEG